MQLYVKPIFIFLRLLLFLFIFSGCKEDDLEKRIHYYNINNEVATERLQNISYNKTHAYDHLERFKITHFSDLHLSSWSTSNYYKNPYNMIEAVKFSNQKDLKINAIVCTGDFISSRTTSQKTEALNYIDICMNNLYTNNDIPTFTCLGNHDQNMIGENPATHIDSKRLHQTLTTKTNYPISIQENKNYYYTDLINPLGGKIRLIAMDPTNEEEDQYNSHNFAYYSQEQINWLSEKALKENMTSEHSIIIINHYPFINPINQVNCSFTHNSYMIPEIVETFRKKEKFRKEYENYLFPAYPIVVDIDFTNVPGEFICYMTGHLHTKLHFTLDKLPNVSTILLPQNVFVCSNSSPSDSYDFSKIDRKEKSLIDNSFCLYAIDTNEKNIYWTFFGAYLPKDEPDYPAIQIIPYLLLCPIPK